MIKCQDAELIAAKVVIDQQFPRDFIGACAYFSQQVARIHGPAQLEYKQQRSKKRGIYAIDSRAGRGGRGRGRTGNRGGRGRGGGYQGRGNHTNMINGVDISDPTRNFTSQEWDTLGEGRAIVMQMRNRANGRGNNNQGTGRGRGRGRGRGGNRNAGTNNVSSVTFEDEVHEQDESQSGDTRNERGGRNGRGFGRGAYGNSQRSS
jgi:hypothetical protein